MVRPTLRTHGPKQSQCITRGSLTCLTISMLGTRPVEILFPVDAAEPTLKPCPFLGYKLEWKSKLGAGWNAATSQTWVTVRKKACVLLRCTQDVAGLKDRWHLQIQLKSTSKTAVKLSPFNMTEQSAWALERRRAYRLIYIWLQCSEEYAV